MTVMLALCAAIAFGASQSGRYLHDFLYYGFNADEAGRPVFDKLREEGKRHPIEEVGRKLRETMSWIRDAKKDSSEADATGDRAQKEPKPAADGTRTGPERRI